MPSSDFCLGFNSHIYANTRILILGSMPSVASLAAGQYYAHPRNRFWPLMALLLENTDAPADYQARLDMLARHSIGLWDALHTCARSGSLDSAITDEEPNDFLSVVERFPHIHTIACNGGKAWQVFKKHNKPLLTRPGLRCLQLPSTSPANARMSLEQLAEVWKEQIFNLEKN